VSERVPFRRSRTVPPMCTKLLLAFLFSHPYAVTDGGHRVRRSGANPPLTRRQSDYLVANHLGSKRTCQCPATIKLNNYTILYVPIQTITIFVYYVELVYWKIVRYFVLTFFALRLGNIATTNTELPSGKSKLSRILILHWS